MRDDRSDEIADALDWLHAGGWSVGDTAFFDIENSDQVWVVTGSNGENMIWTEGATCAEAWQRALDQAAAVGMLPGRPRPTREEDGGPLRSASDNECGNPEIEEEQNVSQAWVRRCAGSGAAGDDRGACSVATEASDAD